VSITPEALEQFAGLPKPIQARVRNVVARLQKWPDVSGAKPMRGNLTGNYRIRTGDYRIVFKALPGAVVIWKLGYRGDIYD